MIDQAATVPAVSGPEAMARLADRLATLAPAQHPFGAAQLPRRWDAEGLAQADDRSRRRRSLLGRTVDAFNTTCASIPYGLVALALRLVMARVFFFDGQTRIDGAPIPLFRHGFEVSAVLPAQLKADAAAVFAHVPHLPPMLVAWAVAGAEFALPILLVLGLATRFSALVLLGLTVLLQIYVTPDALWTAHVYWISILLVLISLGAGQISLDASIRFLVRR